MTNLEIISLVKHEISKIQDKINLYNSILEIYEVRGTIDWKYLKENISNSIISNMKYSEYWDYIEIFHKWKYYNKVTIKLSINWRTIDNLDFEIKKQVFLLNEYLIQNKNLLNNFDKVILELKEIAKKTKELEKKYDRENLRKIVFSNDIFIKNFH